MTFPERYQIADRWQDRVLIMNLFHTAATQINTNWTLRKTALIFDCSIGLVSENLRLANGIDSGSSINECNTRQEALSKIERRTVWRVGS